MGVKKRGVKQFLRERIRRLIIPVLFCIVTIGPLSGYILAKSRYGFEGNFYQFYPHFFSEVKKYLFWGHMWFCVYLYIFSLAGLPCFLFLLKNVKFLKKINEFLLYKKNLLLPALLFIIIEGILRPFYPGYQSFWGDWANVCVHFSFYVLGFIIALEDKIFIRILNLKKIFLSLAVVSTLCFMVYKIL